MQMIPFLILASLLASCGKSDSNAGLPRMKSPQMTPLNEVPRESLYMAKFKTLNTEVVGAHSGNATIERQGDQFRAYVTLSEGAPEVLHHQDIHEGTRCPTSADDLNGDGFIDAVEGENVYGKILIPLDLNIDSQNAGRNIYPEANGYVKIPPQMGLILEGKVVIVHGASETISFPETVATTDDKPQFQTLPITCGVFKRIIDIPGREDDDNDEDEVETESAPRPQGWYDRVIDWWRRSRNSDRGIRAMNFQDSSGRRFNSQP